MNWNRPLYRYRGKQLYDPRKEDKWAQRIVDDIDARSCRPPRKVSKRRKLLSRKMVVVRRVINAEKIRLLAMAHPGDTGGA